MRELVREHESSPALGRKRLVHEDQAVNGDGFCASTQVCCAQVNRVPFRRRFDVKTP
jgi:hypothetical protein